MIHDLSVTGALLLVRTHLAVGDQVGLQLFIAGDLDDARFARGSGSSASSCSDGRRSASWTHRIAVQFDAPLTEFEPEIKALADKQRALGLRP